MPLTPANELVNDTIKLIQKFQTGEIKPVSTGIKHLDKALNGGLLPGTVLGIVARAAHGKSYDAERIQRHITKEHDDVLYINANWELSYFKILIRDICQQTGLTTEEVLFKVQEGDSLDKLKEICNSHRTDRVLYQNEPVTPEVFSQDIESVIEANKDKKIVVSIDNLENILVSKGDQKTSMDALLYQVNRLKNLHPFISFIILNQMNNNYTLRMDDLKKQKPLDSDIYGTDQLTKLCDVLYVKIIPFKLGIRDQFMVFWKGAYSWLEEFKIKGKKDLAHFDPVGVAYYFYLKRRTADPKDIQDVFAERLFTRADVDLEPEPEETPKETAPPLFSSETFMTPGIVGAAPKD